MAKSAQAFRTIREVADWLGVAAHVLRFWESKFSQIRPVKRAGGRRYYRPSDMELVGGIKVLLHDRGMTIRGVKKLISDEGVAAVAALSPPLDALLEDNDVVDITPDKEWDEDIAAETAVPAPDDATEEAKGETEDAPGPVPPISDVAPPPASEPPLSAPAPEAPTAESPTPNEAELPTPASAEVQEMPREAPDTVTVPRPADGAIARLAEIAQTPDKLAPHLSALKSLRDRMQDLAPSE